VPIDVRQHMVQNGERSPQASPPDLRLYGTAGAPGGAWSAAVYEPSDQDDLVVELWSAPDERGSLNFSSA
jgi:hypothetical protein